MSKQNFEYAQNFTIAGYRLELTCGACPEQYDVYLGEDQVGYLRLRHGYFRAENAESVVVYSADCKGDGVFDDEEREHHLSQAIVNIHLNRTSNLIEGSPIERIMENCDFQGLDLVSTTKLIDNVAERIATVLEDKYRVVEYNRPDVDLISHDELVQTIKEAIRTQ